MIWRAWVAVAPAWFVLCLAQASAQSVEGSAGGGHFGQSYPAAPLPRVEISVRARFGVTTAPFYTEPFPEVRGQGLVGLLSGGYRLSPQYQVGVLLPIAALQVRQPAGAYVNETTWGNPALFAAHQQVVPLPSGATLRSVARVTLALPLGEQGPSGSLMSNRALAIAGALEGWRLQELYVPGRLSLAPSVDVAYLEGRIGAEAGLKLPLLFRTSRAGLPGDSDTHVVGVMAVVHAGLGLRVASWFVPALRADLVVDAVPAVEPARGPTRAVQLLVEPELLFRLSRHLGLAVDFMVPAAGALGGTTYAGSLGLTAQ